ncbi:hypothetical protein FB565_004595 [Actinoplanes lutulentus]|uniref:FlgD immunoglobulin-like domain containing protein n=1 Tax=Actinoplanes lutulentus TaxID=1287878 RepID=UPI000DB931C7|nr:FlgD immunoglobulin-like domain containing protein [Actinoplanes lutulentus]MBB2944862.1 hypothetical protein [Actinoplanes lutulentus]
MNAGDSGFLWVQEGDDRLLWTGYANGVTSAVGQRLASPIRYDIDSGRWSGGISGPGYGRGSDVIAIQSDDDPLRISLLRANVAIGDVMLPAEHNYLGTYGETVVSRAGEYGSTDTYHLWRLTNGLVTEVVATGIPAGAGLITIEDGDARSIILRYVDPQGTNGNQRWGIVDLADGEFTPLPDRIDGSAAWEVEGFRLGADSILRLRGDKVDVLDRADTTAVLHQVVSPVGIEADFGITGSAVLAVEPISPGDNQYRGQALWAMTGSRTTKIMDPAAFQITPAPDGSVLVAGAQESVAEGDLDWGIYRISEAGDGSIVRTRVIAVEPAPADVYGLSLGSGVLTTADNSTIYEGSAIIGSYRSAWISSGTAPRVTRSTVDGLVLAHQDEEPSCPVDKSRCIHMFADGAGHHGRVTSDEHGSTLLYSNGARSNDGPAVPIGSTRAELADLSGRYGIVEDGAQYLVDFHDGAILKRREHVAAAIWGSTLWSSTAPANFASESAGLTGVIQATRLPDGAVLESFATRNGCIPSELQAVGRWVYWVCKHFLGGIVGAGIYDRATKRTVTAPADEVLLGDGYLVEQVTNTGLRLIDLHNGLPASGSYADLPSRVLASAAQLGFWAMEDDQDAQRTNWTVDRFGGGVAYVDTQQRVHIVPTGTPAADLAVIDAEVGAKAVNWTGSWWLSKPASSWQLTIRSTTGAILRTINGSTAHGLIEATWDGKDPAGRAVADNAFTWTLTATPADGRGAALAVGNALIATKAPAISGTLAVGSTVKASTGTWLPAPASYAYQWSANGVAISGATGSAYPIPAAMLGKRLTVTVTAKRAGHLSGVATSAASAAVVAGSAPKASKAPTISGTVAVGSTVTASTGTWSPTAASYAYQWSANGVAIKGATGSAYPIPAAMLGKRLTVTVTAKRAGHVSGVAKSAASAAVAKGKAPKATKKPKITGTAKVGKKVKASAGTWSPKATAYQYEWRLNGKLIKGATGATLKLKSSMRGKKLTVTVIAKRPGHTNGRATSPSVKVR